MTSQDLFYIKKHGWRSWTEKLQRSRAWGPDIEELASFRLLVLNQAAGCHAQLTLSHPIKRDYSLSRFMRTVGGRWGPVPSIAFHVSCRMGAFNLKRETKVIRDKSNVGHFRLSQFGIMLHSRKFNAFLESCHLTIAPEYILHKARSHPTLKNMFVEHSSLINPRSN